MHIHFPTNTTFLAVSPVAGVLLAFILMIVFDRTLTDRGHGTIGATLGILSLIIVPLIGIALPFLIKA